MCVSTAQMALSASPMWAGLPSISKSVGLSSSGSFSTILTRTQSLVTRCTKMSHSEVTMWVVRWLMSGSPYLYNGGGKPELSHPEGDVVVVSLARVELVQGRPLGAVLGDVLLHAGVGVLHVRYVQRAHVAR